LSAIKNRVESLLARTWKSRRAHPAKSFLFRVSKVTWRPNSRDTDLRKR